MKKEYGQDLRKSLEQTRIKLNNLNSKIIKRFDLILCDYQHYMSDEEKNYIHRVGLSDLTIEKKLEIVINVEDRYVKEHSRQGDLFSNL